MPSPTTPVAYLAVVFAPGMDGAIANGDLGLASSLVIFWFCPHFIFYSPLPFQSRDLMSHGLSPDLSPDFHHMITPYCSDCFIVHSPLSASLGDTYCSTHYCSPSPLFPPYCLGPHCSLGPIVHPFRTLSQVAASVVYKPCLYHRRGLKPDLVYQSKCCCSHQTCVPLSSFTSYPFGSSQGHLRLYLLTLSSLQDICLKTPLQGTIVITKGVSPL